jgi:hypothetical protein
VNINKIFGLFETPEEKGEDIVQNDYNNLLENYKNHPLFWVGMVKKLIYNHTAFNDRLLDFFSQLDKSLDKIDIDRAGEYIIFNRAWDYIEKVDPTNHKHQEALFYFADVHLKVALELLLNYFQEQEEYEKCAHLKSNLDFVKLLLA